MRGDWEPIVFWPSIIGGIIAVIGIVTYYELEHDQRVTEMVKNGAAPLEARCALDNGDDRMCYTLTARRH